MLGMSPSNGDAGRAPAALRHRKSRAQHSGRAQDVELILFHGRFSIVLSSSLDQAQVNELWHHYKSQQTGVTLQTGGRGRRRGTIGDTAASSSSPLSLFNISGIL